MTIQKPDTLTDEEWAELSDEERATIGALEAFRLATLGGNAPPPPDPAPSLGPLSIIAALAALYLLSR